MFTDTMTKVNDADCNVDNNAETIIATVNA